ncbi:MAG: hypothetical protein OXK81_04305, partial [Chloroflexota bacterium]|nr:hypothetical protein [Chloroflexota bacterium]
MGAVVEKPSQDQGETRPAPASQSKRRDARFPLVVLALAVALLVTLTLAVTIGPVAIAPLTVWQIAVSRLTGLASGEWSAAHENIVWLIRLPRV